MGLGSKIVAVKSLVSGAAWAGGVSNIVSYAAPQIWAQSSAPQNLKRKYGAEWALVTGASSGIGAAVTERLAQQGINVVVVALDDKVLADFTTKLQAKYPKVQFRFVPTNLGKFPAQGADDYMEAIKAATADIHVSIVVSNAGYVVIDGLHRAPLDKQLNNIECMVLSYVKIVDHFYKKMVAAKKRGAIFMTSSQGAFFPSPLSTVYSGCKAFVASYGHALAVEAKSFGIDVLVTHPGYVRSNFTRDLPKLQLWKQLDKIGQTPFELADNMLRAIGRIFVLDSGIFSWGSRLATKLIDTNALLQLIAATAHMNPDFRRLFAPSARL